MSRLMALLLISGLAVAADVDEQIRRLRGSLPDDLVGTGALVTALQQAYEAGSWETVAQRRWLFAIARAQLHAEMIDPAGATLQRLGALLESDQRGSWQDLRIEHWRLQLGRDPEQVVPESLVDTLRQEQAAVPQLVAAHVAEAERFELQGLLEPALQACDAALALLADAEPAKRTALYHRRVLVMEAAQMPVVAIQDWLQAQNDAAAETVREQVGTRSDAIVGLRFPDAEIPLLEAPQVQWRLSKEQGRPVLLYVYAHWAPSCRVTDPLVAAVAATHPELSVVCWSLHHEGQLAQAQAYALEQQLPGTLIGHGLGWQEPALPALGVEAVPHLILIAGDGVIQATDLVTGDPDRTRARIGAALRDLADQAPVDDELLPALP